MQEPRPLATLRDRLRAKHYSLQTEKAYVQWVRRFAEFTEYRHPRELGAKEVERFLTDLAVRGRVAAATQNQALAALLFLYRDVLGTKLPWLESIVRAKHPQRLSVVLTPAEVQAVLGRLQRSERLIAELLYGSGLRLTECLRLRIKDVDLKYRQIVVRDGKGQKDRVTMLPDVVRPELAAHIARVRNLYQSDRDENRPGVSLPFALRRKYPAASTSWGLVLSLSGARLHARRARSRTRPSPCTPETRPALCPARGMVGGHRQAGKLSHLATLLRNPSS